jgi:hypothetical protein
MEMSKKEIKESTYVHLSESIKTEENKSKYNVTCPKIFKQNKYTLNLPIDSFQFPRCHNLLFM